MSDIVPVRTLAQMEPTVAVEGMFVLLDDVLLTLEAYAAELSDVPESHPDLAKRQRVSDEMFLMADHFRGAVHR